MKTRCQICKIVIKTKSAEESEIRNQRRSLLFQMAGVLRSLSFWMIISVYVTFLVLAQDGGQFVHYDFKNSGKYLDGIANTHDSPLHLTNNTETSTGHAFHKSPMKFTASSSSSLSFSTEFIFAIIPLQNPPS